MKQTTEQKEKDKKQLIKWFKKSKGLEQSVLIGNINGITICKNLTESKRLELIENSLKIYYEYMGWEK